MQITTSYFASYQLFPIDTNSNPAASTATNASANSASTSAATANATSATKTSTFNADTLAQSILSFVQDRVTKAANQGASKDQLNALLTQARDGVTAGFNQAVGQIKNSDALTDTLSSGISSALQKVDSGLDDLAKQLGLTTQSTVNTSSTSATTPTTTSGANTTGSLQTNNATTSATQTLSQLAAAYGTRLTARQSIDLVVKTAEGDVVHLRLGVKDKLSIGAGSNNPSSSLGEKLSAGLSISVKGNLNVDEKKAIGDLLDQVGNLANSFFNGDINSTLQQANALDLSNPELSSLSLDLRSSVAVKAKLAAYTAVQSLGNNSSPTTDTSLPTTTASSTTPITTSTSTNSSSLSDALTSLLPQASIVQNPANLLKQFLAAQFGANDQQNNPLLDLLDHFLTALGADNTNNSSTASSNSPAPTTPAAAASSNTAASTSAAS